MTSNPRHRRRRLAWHASVGALAAVLLLVAGLAQVSGAARSDPRYRPHVSGADLAYDLVSANGAVTSFGHAGNYGGAEKLHLNAPIVGIAPTPDGRGYWLVAQDGGVFTYGDAKYYGSLGGVKHSAAHDEIAIVPTKDGKGYWLCDASGVVTPFGDAGKLLPVTKGTIRTPIIGFAVMPDGLGGWVVNSLGNVYRLGDSSLYGSLRSKKLADPIVAAAATLNGHGYWLTDATGKVSSFGNASPPVTPPLAMKGAVVAMTAAPKYSGYWAVTNSGYVVPGGVPSLGGLNESGPDAIVGITRTLAVADLGPSPYASGSLGYDINWPQCKSSGSDEAGDLPGPPHDPSGTSAYSVAIVGVDGWAVDDYNPCVGAEVKWAEKATEKGTKNPAPYELYLFLNAPAPTSTIDQSGPGGTCSKDAAGPKEVCLAYNYGYNAALDAVSYASSKGASAALWWLDIENDACAPGEWNDAGNGEWWSCDQHLNAETIQGALDGLHHDKLAAGIYSTSIQWKGITGGYTPSGAAVPLWIAGAYWTSPPYPSSYGYFGTSHLTPWCDGDYDFAGGKAVLLQETPGSNDYPYDPDFAC